MQQRILVPEDLSRSALNERGMRALVRSVISIADGKLNPGTTTEKLVARRWGSGAVGEIASVMRAASAPAMTSQVGWARELAPVTTAFLAALVPLSASADLLSRVLHLSFDGAAHISVPTVTTPFADFVAEGANIPVVQGTSGGQMLEPYKFAVITTLSRETTESGNAEALTRDALLNSSGPSLDRRLFDSQPGVAGLRPPGLLYGITPITAAGASGGKDDAMKDDLQAIVSAVAPVAGNGSIVIIAAPAQAVAINLRTLGTFSYDVLTSTQLPNGVAIAVATNAIVSASGDAPQIDVTKVASVQLNDSPTGDLLSGGHVIAAFQTDVVGLRLRWPLSWQVRDPRGIAYVTGVSW
jgi:hypothetical protein